MTYYCYEYNHPINSMSYIGITNDIKGRHAYHRKHKPWIKEFNLKPIVLETSDSLDEIKELEKEYIKKRNCIHPNGYNLNPGGAGPGEDGKKRISEARKNTMPVKDAKTGKMIGSVSTTHPKVLSGEWVHHTKGTTPTQEARDNLSKAMKGLGNNNAYSELTVDKINQLALDVVTEYGRIVKTSQIRKMVILKHGIKIPSSGYGCRESNETLIQYLERETGWKYNSFYKTPEMKKITSIITRIQLMKQYNRINEHKSPIMEDLLRIKKDFEKRLQTCSEYDVEWYENQIEILDERIADLSDLKENDDY